MVRCHLSVLLPTVSLAVVPTGTGYLQIRYWLRILSELDVLGMFSAPAEDPWLIGDAINDFLELVIVVASSTKCRIFASSAEDHWTLQLRFNGPQFCEALLRSNGQF